MLTFEFDTAPKSCDFCGGSGKMTPYLLPAWEKTDTLENKESMMAIEKGFYNLCVACEEQLANYIAEENFNGNRMD